jgi:prohibitin 2
MVLSPYNFKKGGIMSDSAKLKGFLLLAAVVFVFVFGSSLFYVVEPGYRGIAKTFGTVDPNVKGEGFGFKTPWTTIILTDVRQKTVEHTSLVFSKDQQELTVHFKVFYKPKETEVINLYQKYAGDPFTSLVLPRIEESLKEQTVLLEATQILNEREKVKFKSLENAQKKIEKMVDVQDLSLVDIDFSPELKRAIEEKMVASQDAQKAVYKKNQVQVEAETALIKAQGEANAIKVQGEALKNNPSVLQLEIVRKWDGKSPTTVVNGGTSMLLPLK